VAFNDTVRPSMLVPDILLSVTTVMVDTLKDRASADVLVTVPDTFAVAPNVRLTAERVPSVVSNGATVSVEVVKSVSDGPNVTVLLTTAAWALDKAGMNTAAVKNKACFIMCSKSGISGSGTNT